MRYRLKKVREIEEELRPGFIESILDGTVHRGCSTYILLKQHNYDSISI
jgi:hypothetical protein